MTKHNVWAITRTASILAFSSRQDICVLFFTKSGAPLIAVQRELRLDLISSVRKFKGVFHGSFKDRISIIKKKKNLTKRM